MLIAMSMRPIITSIGPLLDVLKQSLHLSNAAVTSLTAVPIIAMGLFASLAPWMERTFGMKRSIQMLLLLLLGASAIRYVAFGWTELLVTSLVGGIAIAVLGPLLSSYVRTYYEKQFDRMIGWYSFGVGFGAMLSASATPALYEWGGLPFALAIWAVIPFAARSAGRSENETSHTMTHPQTAVRRGVRKRHGCICSFSACSRLFFSPS